MQVKHLNGLIFIYAYRSHETGQRLNGNLLLTKTDKIVIILVESLNSDICKVTWRAQLIPAHAVGSFIGKEIWAGEHKCLVLACKCPTPSFKVGHHLPLHPSAMQTFSKAPGGRTVSFWLKTCRDASKPWKDISQQWSLPWTGDKERIYH